MIDSRMPGELQTAIDPDARLQQFREAFVHDATRAMVWLTLCMLPLSYWRNFIGNATLRWPQAFALLAVASALLTASYLYRHRLSYRFKSRMLLSVLFLAGAGGLVSFGQAAPTGNYFTMAFVVAAILYARSLVVAMIGGTVALIALVGYAAVTGLHVVVVNISEVSRQPAAWLNLTLSMALTTGAIAAALGAFMRSVYGLLGDVHRQQLEIEQQRDQIRHLATHDNLTGLPMLRLANDRSRVAIARAQRAGRKVGFMFIDLDGFKAINDLHGHDAGDAVLKEVAQRLKTAVRASDTAARIGGDEFLVILGDLSEAEQAADVAAKILHTLAAPITHGRHQIGIGASIGISLFPDHAGELDALKKAADTAMYRVKAAGKNAFVFAGEQPAPLPLSS